MATQKPKKKEPKQSVDTSNVPKPGMHLYVPGATCEDEDQLPTHIAPPAAVSAESPAQSVGKERVETASTAIDEDGQRADRDTRGGDEGESAKPAKPAEPVKPAAPKAPETPAKPAKPAEPVKSAAPETPAKPAKPAKPVKPAATKAPAEPGKAVAPVEDAKPAQCALGGDALAATVATAVLAVAGVRRLYRPRFIPIPLGKGEDGGNYVHLDASRSRCRIRLGIRAQAPVRQILTDVAAAARTKLESNGWDQPFVEVTAVVCEES